MQQFPGPIIIEVLRTSLFGTYGETISSWSFSFFSKPSRRQQAYLYWQAPATKIKISANIIFIFAKVSAKVIGDTG